MNAEFLSPFNYVEFLSRAVLVPENHLDSPLIFMSGVGNVHTIYSTTAGAMSYMRKSEWSRCRLNDLSCKCTVHRWNRLELSFLLMYGTNTTDEICFCMSTSRRNDQYILHWYTRGCQRILTLSVASVQSSEVTPGIRALCPVSWTEWINFQYDCIRCDVKRNDSGVLASEESLFELRIADASTTGSGRE